MSNRIVVDPVTRIEGHAKIDIFLDDDRDAASVTAQLDALARERA